MKIEKKIFEKFDKNTKEINDILSLDNIIEEISNSSQYILINFIAEDDMNMLKKGHELLTGIYDFTMANILESLKENEGIEDLKKIYIVVTENNEDILDEYFQTKIKNTFLCLMDKKPIFFHSKYLMPQEKYDEEFKKEYGKYFRELKSDV